MQWPKDVTIGALCIQSLCLVNRTEPQLVYCLEISVVVQDLLTIGFQDLYAGSLLGHEHLLQVCSRSIQWIERGTVLGYCGYPASKTRRAERSRAWIECRAALQRTK